MILTIKKTATKALIGAMTTAVLAGALAAQTTGAAADLRAQAAALGVTAPAAVPTPAASPAGGVSKTGEPKASAMVEGPAEHKMAGTCSFEGRKVSYTVQRWETGVMTTKDAAGNEVRQSFEYPIIAPLNDFHTMGDFGPCWNVCHDVCDGYGVCWAACTIQCARHGGPGDPRRP